MPPQSERLPVGARVRLVEEKCPKYYRTDQSRGNLGIIEEVQPQYYYVRWDNGHRNTYTVDQVASTARTNREAVWMLKR